MIELAESQPLTLGVKGGSRGGWLSMSRGPTKAMGMRKAGCLVNKTKGKECWIVGNRR